VKQEVEIFEHGELESLFKVCTPYHLTIYNFLLMTGLREQEAMYCVWNDVNLKAGTINMRWKPQYDFAPKAYREREVPIPTKLVETLRAFRPRTLRTTPLSFAQLAAGPILTCSGH
jgi:integrase/recombinase XerD